MKFIAFLMLFLPFGVRSQVSTGIQFQDGVSWNEVLKRAKSENKFIFIDVNATWCMPCRKMENEIFSQKEVGDAYNSNFLSIRVQIDKTEKDDEYVRSWYEEAKNISKKYAVLVVPTFLYLSPDGELLQRSVGYQPKDNFVNAAKTALDAKENMANMKTGYLNGKMKSDSIPSFAILLKNSGQKEFADSVALNYKVNILDKAADSDLKKVGNLIFIRTFSGLINSSDKYFNLFYRKEREMDSLFKKNGLSKNIANSVIYKEEIKNLVDSYKSLKKGDPDWDMLESRIGKKYTSDISHKLILTEKSKWYTNNENWPLAIKYGLELISDKGIEIKGIESMQTNNFIYKIVFLHGENKLELAKSAEIMKVLTKSNPDKYTWLDTYANILYKMGEKEKAIELEEKGLKIIKEGKFDKKEELINTWNKVIERMKNGEPTWNDN
jgi:thioredoxin-related protein